MTCLLGFGSELSRFGPQLNPRLQGRQVFFVFKVSTIISKTPGNVIFGQFMAGVGKDFLGFSYLDKIAQMKISGPL
jgi:hypothetical protein